MALSHYIDTLSLLGDEHRIRLCALLRDRELCVTDLVRATGLAQPRVSTQLGRLRDAGVLRDRRHGTQSFYALANELPITVKAFLEEAARSGDATLEGDQLRLDALEAERRGATPDALVDQLERDYSPGRTWHSLAVGMASLLKLGDVLDIGSGDGAAAAVFAPHCRSLTCIDSSARMIDAAKKRLAGVAPKFRALVADAHALPFANASFDTVLVFHTLTYTAEPAAALAEGARVLRPGGRLVLLCLDEHKHFEVTARFGDRHAGFSPRTVRQLLTRAGLQVASCEVACREAKKSHLRVVLATADKPHKRGRKS